MSNGDSVHVMIIATDESVELYHMEDVQWVEWVLLGWFVVGAAIAVWFLTIIVIRQHAWLSLTLLGVASVGLIAGGPTTGSSWAPELIGTVRHCGPALRVSTLCESPKRTDIRCRMESFDVVPTRKGTWQSAQRWRARG